VYLEPDGGAMLRHVAVLDAGACRLEEFRALVEVETSLEDFPHADGIEGGAVVYDMASLTATVRDRTDGPPSADPEIRNEIASALSDGPGIVVFLGGVDPTIVDRATEVLDRIIADEKASSIGGGDHFAEPGRTNINGLGLAGESDSTSPVGRSEHGMNVHQCRLLRSPCRRHSEHYHQN